MLEGGDSPTVRSVLLCFQKQAQFNWAYFFGTKEQKNKSEQKAKLSTKVATTEIDLGQFDDLFNKIIKKNSLRPYPDINDIPN